MLTRGLTETLRKSNKSALLLGPRQTGKSTLIASLKPDLHFNFADESTFLDFSQNPSLIREVVKKEKPRTLFIDEVQRLPSLLNTLQTLLDADPGLRVLLTGSSARKLKRGQANLLPGRLLSYRLGPLTQNELGDRYELRKAMETGLLPGVYLEETTSVREKTLSSYAGIYLREEIQAEALTKSIEGFSRFLSVTAAHSGHLLDLSKLSSLSQVPRQTIVRFFEILEDTLVLYRCPPYARSEKKRLIQHPKFYFFDCGVLNGLLGNFEASSDRIGNLFEHLVFQEILHTSFALDQDVRISFFRSSAGTEVDLIVEKDRKTFAIEIKASRNVGKTDTRSLKSFREYHGGKNLELIVTYLGEHARSADGVEILPLRETLHAVFGKER